MATEDEIGRAEAYKAAVIFNVAPVAAPAWLQAIQANIAQQIQQSLQPVINDIAAIRNDITAIRNDITAIRNNFTAIRNDITTLNQELPIFLANSQAGLREPLYDPRQTGQWVLLAAPNPTTKTELMSFTGKFVFNTNLYLI